MARSIRHAVLAASFMVGGILATPALAQTTAPTFSKDIAPIFQSKCQRCHGAEGKGNGPEADKDHKPADLTQIKTADNPEGVLFYKVWNGHAPKAGSKGEMPAFKVQLPKEDIWRAVEYVKTLHE